MIKKITQLAKYMDRLKYSKKSIYMLIVLNSILTIGSFIADWEWLTKVPRHLIIFAPICSLYPLLLLIWILAWNAGKKIPACFTAFMFVGLFSYGIMAWIYFPLYMTWKGINFHDVASIFWVVLYALQAFIIASELKKIPLYQYGLIVSYFLLKVYSDRYLGTFLDHLLPGYPDYLVTLFTVSMVTLHLIGFFLIIYLPQRKNVGFESQKTQKN